MKIELFINDISDDFTEFHEHGKASTGWLDSKSKPVLHDQAKLTVIPIDLKGENDEVKHLSHLFLRREEFGGLAFDGSTGKVFQLDIPAFDLLYSIQSGIAPKEAIEAAAKNNDDVAEFLDALVSFGLLDQEMKHLLHREKNN